LNVVIQLKRLNLMTPLLEAVLSDLTEKREAGSASFADRQL